jgi:hypothetical protein
LRSRRRGVTGRFAIFGEIDTTEAATRKLVIKLAAKYRRLTFCYEAGPTGYGLHRLIGMLANLKSGSALAALVCIGVGSMTGGASAITAKVAKGWGKKCVWKRLSRHWV